MKNEFKAQDIDALQCLDGFTIVLGHDLDIIYVSETVSDFIGLTQVSSDAEGSKVKPARFVLNKKPAQSKPKTSQL